MSLAVLKTVQKARQDQGSCYKCHDALPAGGPYRYFRAGFRGPKRKVCMKPECTPKQSERESSKLADVYAAQEEAYTAIEAATTVEEVDDAITTLQDAVDTVIGEYEDSVTEMPALEDTVRPNIEALEDYSANLSNFAGEVPEEDDDDERREELLADAKNEAGELVDGLEL